MAAAYSSLAGSAGFLRFWSSLNATSKAEAESAANAFVDAEFAEWDRSGWSGSSVPTEIAMICSRIGAAEYIVREYLATNPEGGGNREIMPSVVALRAEALEMVAQTKARGFLLGHSGQRLHAMNASGKSSFNIEIVR